MTRAQRLLAALLGAQVVLLLIATSPWTSGSGVAAATTLLPELQSFTPAKIEISHGAETLVLDHADDTWRIEQAGGYPADGTKVQKLLDDLKKLEVRRPVVKSDRYHAALHVTQDDNERRLRFWEAGSESPRVELLVGSSPNYGINHVRRADRKEVYEVQGLSPWDMRPEANSWIETQLVNVTPESVRSLALTNDHGRFELVRDDAGAFRLASGAAAGAELDPAAADEFARSIGSLRLSRPAGRAGGAGEFGLDRPAARLDLVYAPEGGASTSFELVVGAAVAGDSGERYARASGSDFAVILGKWDAERILDKKVGDLLKSHAASQAGTGSSR